MLFKQAEPLLTHYSQHRYQPVPGHPQVGQREQGDHVRGVLLQPAEPHLHQTELALDHPERVLHFDPNAGLAVFVLLHLRLGPAFGHRQPAARSCHALWTPQPYNAHGACGVTVSRRGCRIAANAYAQFATQGPAAHAAKFIDVCGSQSHAIRDREDTARLASSMRERLCTPVTNTC
jgi:hypothetical protein